MIILKELTWANMFCYGESNSLSLDKDVATQILGTNGAGKSSINLILEELLYNKNSKGIKKADILNRHSNADSYSASLTFSISGVEYFVKLERKGVTSKVQLLENSVDISSHTATGTYKALAEILGDDFSTFSQKIYQGMTSSLQFLTATDSARKKFLIGLLSLEEYSLHETQIKAYSLGLAGEVKALKTSVEATRAWIKSTSEERLNEPLPLVDVPEVDESLETELTDLMVLSKMILKNNSEVDRRATLERELTNVSVASTRAKLDVEPMGSIVSDIKEAQTTAAPSRQIISKLKQLSDKCPTCLSDINRDVVAALISEHSQIMEFCNEQEEQLTRKKESIREAQRHNEKIEAAIKEEIRIRETIEPLASESSDADELHASVQAVKNTIAEQKVAVKTATAANLVAVKTNARLEGIAKQWEDVSLRIEAEELRLLNISKEASRVDILKKAFGPKGIVAYKIESMVKDLEEHINLYLGEFANGRFGLHFVLDNDKLNISIMDNGQQINIQALSSGELARVNISTVLAIRKLMSSNSTNNINLLFLDEITNVLDQEGREQLIQILLKEPVLNTFIISHGWQHPLVPRIEVIKENNIAAVHEA